MEALDISSDIVTEATEYRSSVFLDPDFNLNPTEIERDVTFSLTDRVKLIETKGALSEYLIDGCLHVRGPSDVFRREAANFWTERENTYSKWANGGWFVTVVCLAVTAFTARTPIAIISGVVSTVLAGITSGFIMAGVYSASKRVEEWNTSPTTLVAHQRALAYQKGYPFAYSHNLRGVLHPSELEYLYKKYFPVFCEELIGKEESACLQEFTGLNPLSPEMIKYAFGEVPPFLKSISEDYVKLRSILQEVKKSFDRLRSEVRANRDQLIENLEKHKVSVLAPLKERRDTQIAVAKGYLDTALKDHPLETDPLHQQALDDYKKDKKRFEEEYEAAAKPLRDPIEEQIEEAGERCRKNIESLEKKEQKQNAAYSSAVRELIDRATKAWTTKFYLGLKLDQYFPATGLQN